MISRAETGVGPISLPSRDFFPILRQHRITTLQAPTVFNAAGQISEHWIGNRVDVEDQAKQAVVGPPSFGMPSYEAAEKRLKEIKGYGPLFKEAFPDDKDPVTVDNFAKAVGAFEKTLVTPSRFDAFVKGESTALSDNQKRGLKTFIETGCRSVLCMARTLPLDRPPVAASKSSDHS